MLCLSTLQETHIKFSQLGVMYPNNKQKIKIYMKTSEPDKRMKRRSHWMSLKAIIMSCKGNLNYINLLFIGMVLLPNGFQLINCIQYNINFLFFSPRSRQENLAHPAFIVTMAPFRAEVVEVFLQNSEQIGFTGVVYGGCAV